MKQHKYKGRKGIKSPNYFKTGKPIVAVDKTGKYIEKGTVEDDIFFDHKHRTWAVYIKEYQMYTTSHNYFFRIYI